uniref:uncharacterized protein LOC122598672 n=1 Tax=Erigeron canadensis TaxID=72917 RepID=UPI001CB925FF|nr:uncharacterized protein LOC122598672 [Erigeron canadensis]
MPPSHNLRKAAHKKKKAKANKSSVSSSVPRSRHGENGGGKVSSKASKSQHKSPLPGVKVEKEDYLSGSESSATENETKEKQGDIEIARRSNSQKQNDKSPNSGSGSIDNKDHDKKKAVVIEPASVADYLSQPLESLLEEGTHKDEDLGVNTPLIVDSVMPAEQILVEVASQLNNTSNTNIEDMNDLVMAKTHLEHKVVKKNDSKINSPNFASKIDELTSKENEVQKPVSLDQKASPKSKYIVLQDSTKGKCLHCGKRSDERVNESEFSERQPLLDSAPQAAEKTSWKCCCGIFELFSGSSQ